MDMEIPFDIDATLKVTNIDREGGVLVLKDADGKLHIFEFAGTISNRPLTDAEKAYGKTLVSGAA